MESLRQVSPSLKPSDGCGRVISHAISSPTIHTTTTPIQTPQHSHHASQATTPPESSSSPSQDFYFLTNAMETPNSLRREKKQANKQGGVLKLAVDEGGEAKGEQPSAISPTILSVARLAREMGTEGEDKKEGEEDEEENSCHIDPDAGGPASSGSSSPRKFCPYSHSSSLASSAHSSPLRRRSSPTMHGHGSLGLRGRAEEKEGEAHGSVNDNDSSSYISFGAPPIEPEGEEDEANTTGPAASEMRQEQNEGGEELVRSPLPALKNLDLDTGGGGGPSGGSNWLLRLFESNCFDVGIAMQYLFAAKEAGVASYLGNRLFRFPRAEVDFYVPQLLAMYVHNTNRLADAIHPYLVARCAESPHFALRCYWLLEAYVKGPEEPAPNTSQPQQPTRTHVYALMKTVLEEHILPVIELSPHRPSAASHLLGSAHHQRSQSDARLDSLSVAPTAGSTSSTPRRLGRGSSKEQEQLPPPPHHLHSKTATTERCASTLAINTHRGVAEENSLDVGSNGTRRSSARDSHLFTSTHHSRGVIGKNTGGTGEDRLAVDQDTPPFTQLEFIRALLQIGVRLRDLSTTKEEKSKRLIYELFVLNFRLPARVWLPIYMGSGEGSGGKGRGHVGPHLVLRIPFNEGCVLNSKEKAPYCIFVEVLALGEGEPAVHAAELPEKMEERFNELHSNLRKLPSPGQSESVVMVGGGENIEQEPERQEQLTQFDSLLAQQSNNSGGDDGEGDEEATESATMVTVREEPPSDLSGITTLAQSTSSAIAGGATACTVVVESEMEMKRRARETQREMLRKRRRQIAPTPEDPSASAMSEPWDEKMERIRRGSPYGHLSNWRLLGLIVKTGDDLRQELLAQQLLHTLQAIWREERVHLYLRPFRIWLCGGGGGSGGAGQSGLIEPIRNACSLHQIRRHLVETTQLDDAQQPYPPTLLSHFLLNYGSRISEAFLRAQENFVRSCAGYSLACYFLQVKDRHNGNILIDDEGHLIHIDFGFILSMSPGRNLGFETSPFKLTPEFIEVMGGAHSEHFAHFKWLMLRGLKAARKHYERLVNLVEIMTTTSSSGGASALPCFRGGAPVIRAMRERFHLHQTDLQLQQLVDSWVEQSRDSLTTRLYDNFQYYTNGIF